MEARHITIIGGANTDISGVPSGPFAQGDSNPGRVRIGLGGVGRNIAQDLAALGAEVSLITALGDDMPGRTMLEGCRALGIDMSMSLIVPGGRSPVYLYIADERGEMKAAVSDMEIVERITPEHLEGVISGINASDAVVIDANLGEEAIVWLAENCRAPIYADTVSGAKAPRLRRALGSLRAIKPNLLEARALCGARTEEDCAAELLARGVGRVFISLGPCGVLAAEGDRRVAVPCESGEVTDTTGAGDAATAAIVWADLHGMSLEQTARAAVRAGAITSRSPGACSAELGRLFSFYTILQ